MRILIPLAAAGALAACGPTPSEPAADNSSTPTAEVPAIPLPKPSPATGLAPVTAAAAALLTGELRCAFSDTAGKVLLTGAADVGDAARPAVAVVWVGEPVRLDADATGGFAALGRGGSFTGGGLTAKLTRGAAEPTGHEGTRHRAQLEVAGDGDEPETHDGIWECGP